MKSILIFFIPLIFLTPPLFSQTTTDTIITNESDLKFKYKNNVQLELLGSAGLYSINYERIIFNQNKYKTVGEIGFSFLSMKDWNGVSFPVSINQLISFQNHHIELGVGVAPNYVSGKYFTGWDDIYSARIGYRYQKPNRKFIFRVGAVPIFAFPGYGIWGAVNFGYGF